MTRGKGGAGGRSGELVRRLVSFDTTSRESNLALIEFVKDYLAGQGVESRLIHDETGGKANLVARIGPDGAPGGVMLSGHTDVVPVDGQEWTNDPFSVVEREGKLYGRGTCDMKGFIAVVLAKVPEMVQRSLKKPVTLVFSYDEEVGCFGARRLIPYLTALPSKPDCCIVGEPTEMGVVAGHKGMKTFRCRVRGVECHSSMAPYGVSAVEDAAVLVARLREMARELRMKGPQDARFDPPYTTIHTGTIRGGTAVNIVSKDCEFGFDIRSLPGEDPDALLAEIRDFAERVLLPDMVVVSSEAGFVFEETASFPGLDVPEDAEVALLVKAVTGANRTGCVSFGTEAGLYHEAGIPTIVCGPGSVRQAHKANEYVELAQLRLCEDFVDRLIERLAAG